MKLPTGNTPRQEIINMALTKMVIFGIEPEWAIEAVLDSAKPKTIGWAMKKYYESLSDEQALRLIATIKRKFQRII